MAEHMNADEQIAELISIIEDHSGCLPDCGDMRCSWCLAERLYNAGYRKEMEDGN